MATAGIAGPLLLSAYFAAPALTGWPFSGATPDVIIDYAKGHTLLFFAGGWLQATGSVLSVVFFLALLQATGRRPSIEGGVVIIGWALGAWRHEPVLLALGAGIVALGWSGGLLKAAQRRMGALRPKQKGGTPHWLSQP